MILIIRIILLINVVVVVVARRFAPTPMIRDRPLLTLAKDDELDYCRISKDHIMCQYPEGDENWPQFLVGTNCFTLDEIDMPAEEGEWIVHKLNKYREEIFRSRKDIPFMMELEWDKELAKLATQWARQCKLSKTDSCRDVARFAVLQNVNSIVMIDLTKDNVKPTPLKFSTFKLLALHLLSFYQYKPFGDHGILEISEGNGLYEPFVTNVGCGRAAYTIGLDINTMQRINRFDDSQIYKIETFVCNWGPFDRERKLNSSLTCKSPSYNYPKLCVKTQKRSDNLNSSTGYIHGNYESMWRNFAPSKEGTTKIPTAVASAQVHHMDFLFLTTLISLLICS